MADRAYLFAMADGSLTITLDEETSARIAAAAQAAGVSPDEYASRLLGSVLDESYPEAGGDHGGWEETQAALDEYRRTGETFSIDEAKVELDRLVAERRARSA